MLLRGASWKPQALGLLAVTVVGGLTVRATGGLGPASGQAQYSGQTQYFNSDSAIPILMANAKEWTPFHLFYFGQDRFGAWPFLIARVAGQVLGKPVTDLGLHAFMTACLLSGALLLGALVPGRRWLVGAVFLGATLGWVEPRATLFDLSQPYAWQIAALLFFWWRLRKSFGAPSTRAHGLTAAGAFFSTWISTSSTPLLLLLVGVEFARARTEAPTEARARRTLRVLLRAMAGVIGTEWIMRGFYWVYGRWTYGKGYRTPLGVDLGHLLENLGVISRMIAGTRVFPWLLLGTAGGLLALYALARPHPKMALTSERRDLAALVLGLWVMAAAHYPLVVALAHVRKSDYAARYLCILLLFGALSGVLTLLAPLLWLRLRVSRALELAVVGAAVATAFLSVPAPVVDPGYAEQMTLARRLAKRSPDAVILGGYWDTYVLAGLVPQAKLVPLPNEDDNLRTPWSKDALQSDRDVFWVTNSERPGALDPPPPWLLEYGVPLMLVEARIDQGGHRVVSRYRNARHRAVGSPAAPELEACARGELTFRFASKEPVVLLARFESAEPLSLSAQPIYADGAQGISAPVLRAGRFGWVRLEGAPLSGAKLMFTPPVRMANATPCTIQALQAVSDEAAR